MAIKNNRFSPKVTFNYFIDISLSTNLKKDAITLSDVKFLKNCECSLLLLLQLYLKLDESSRYIYILESSKKILKSKINVILFL
jgi:hypothetical protein